MGKKIKSIEDRLRQSQDIVSREKDWTIQKDRMIKFLQNNTLNEHMVLSMQEEPTVVDRIISLIGEIEVGGDIDNSTKDVVTLRLEEIIKYLENLKQ
jgi:hypothetical protein